MLCVNQFSRFGARRWPRPLGTATYGDSAAASSHTVNLPAGIREGDVLLLAVDMNASGVTVTTPSGWTLLGSAISSDHRTSVFYKIASGSEGTTLGLSFSTSARCSAIAARLDCAGMPVAATPVTATSSTPDPPSLTPAYGATRSLFVAVAGLRATGGATISAYPSGYDGGVAAYASNFGGVGMAFRQRAVATEDPGTFTWGVSATNIAHTIAVPAA